MPQKFVITGASGFIGKQLVPRLRAAGCDLLLVGRDPDALRTQFPGSTTCSYEDLSDRAQGFDTLVHLAVLNNDVEATAAQFEHVNVTLLADTLAAAKTAGIASFVNITTFHALDGKGSDYAVSKRAALDLLESVKDIRVLNVFLPAVYGDTFAGRLAVVNKVPAALRPLALKSLMALAPTVHVDKLSDFLLHDLPTARDRTMLANSQDNNLVYRIGKTLIDLIFALAVIVFAGWLLLIIWALVKTDSDGPGLFAQERVGRHQRTFTCYKFRTMKTGTKIAGTHEVTAASITKIGAFLRRTKIDELPQVWNILRGELSLVGPRPGLPVQTDLTAAREAHGVFDVLPGITGFAQINDVDMSNPERLARMDARYIAQRSLLMDLKIILGTFLGRGQGDKVRA